MKISETTISSFNWQEFQEPNKRIQVEIFSEPSSPNLIVKKLISIKGPVDIYCWYEGPYYLPKSGAQFMKNCIFEPLYKSKQDAKLCLYSLKAWSKENIADMKPSEPLGKAINRINTAVVQCIYSSSFFQYCMEVSKESSLYAFIKEELPKKKWLFNLSEGRKPTGITVAKLFSDRTSLFDCIKNLDLALAYSPMQYVEGYYLIQESVKKGLLEGEKKIEIVFLLPNDESKYYVDFTNDIETMLQLDFGKDLMGIEIRISFHFFKYGEVLTLRPYVDKAKNPSKVKAKEISAYFNYLFQTLPLQEYSQMPFLRDIIHNLNGDIE